MSNNPEHWTLQEMAERVQGSVLDQSSTTEETISKLSDFREWTATSSMTVYTFTIFTKSGQRFEVTIQELTPLNKEEDDD